MALPELPDNVSPTDVKEVLVRVLKEFKLLRTKERVFILSREDGSPAVYLPRYPDPMDPLELSGFLGLHGIKRTRFLEGLSRL